MLAGSLAFPLRVRAADAFSLPSETVAALESSPLVYVSPIKSDGGESSCHGEVWYSLDGTDVELATAKDTWKTRAVRKGLDRARIWVGDFGQARSADGPFRKGPSFLAHASVDEDPATFERLMSAYGSRYPDGWDKWEPRFRSGYGDGSRILIRYRPVGG